MNGKSFYDCSGEFDIGSGISEDKDTEIIIHGINGIDKETFFAGIITVGGTVKLFTIFEMDYYMALSGSTGGIIIKSFCFLKGTIADKIFHKKDTF